MLARSEAVILHDEILGKAADHEETIRVLSTRSSMQLSAIFNRYKDIYGRSITKDLLNHPTNEYLSALRAAIRCIKNPNRYYAKVLRNAINTVGTDEEALSRVIVTRAEKDLKKITELYFKRNNVSLDQAVAKETSGEIERLRQVYQQQSLKPVENANHSPAIGAGAASAVDIKPSIEKEQLLNV